MCAHDNFYLKNADVNLSTAWGKNTKITTANEEGLSFTTF